MAEKNEFSSLLRRLRIILASRRIRIEHRNPNAELSILNVIPKMDGKIAILYRAFDGRDYTDLIKDPREIDLGILERIVDWIVEHKIPVVEKKIKSSYYDEMLRQQMLEARMTRTSNAENSGDTLEIPEASPEFASIDESNIDSRRLVDRRRGSRSRIEPPAFPEREDSEQNDPDRF